MVAGTLFIISGAIITFALFSQILSAGFGGNQIDLVSLALAVGFSFLSITAIKTFADIHWEYVSEGDKEIRQPNLYSRATARRLASTIVVASFSFFVFWELSPHLQENTVRATYEQIRNGRSNVNGLNLIISAMYQLVYVGSVVTLASTIPYIIYQFYPVGKKVRVWLSRMRIYTAYLIAGIEFSEEERSESCVMCWKQTFQPLAEDESYRCTFCGYPFRFDEKVGKGGVGDIEIADTSTSPDGRQSPGND